MSDVVIKVENLTKEYRLGVINHGTLAKDLQAWWARKRGKEDPNSTLTQLHTYTGQKHGSAPTHLHTSTDKIYALKDINFSVSQGEVLGIIGANGAGKSTILKILSRVTSPTSGSIKIKGRIGSLLEVGTGFHPELTGRENIYLNGAILGMKKWEIDKKLDEIIDFSGVEKFIDTPVKRYSSGMYVRLAFAVAAHLDPEILVVDEVLAVGDAEFQKKCLGKMGDISKKEGRTVLFVSHNMAAVRQLCGRGILLKGGENVLENSINIVVDKYIQNVSMSKKSVWRVGEKDKLSNEIVTLKKLYIRDAISNQQVCLVDGYKQTKICLDFEINGKVEDLTIGVSFFDINGFYLFRTLYSDLNENINEHFKIGLNKISFFIPKDFLNEGKYEVVFDCSIHKKKWISDPLKNKDKAIVFDIINNLPRNKYWFDKRIGIFAPKIRWETDD